MVLSSVCHASYHDNWTIVTSAWYDTAMTNFPITDNIDWTYLLDEDYVSGVITDLHGRGLTDNTLADVAFLELIISDVNAALKDAQSRLLEIRGITTEIPLRSIFQRFDDALVTGEDLNEPPYDQDLESEETPEV